MKHLIILMFFLAGIKGYSQNYQENYKADICACLEENENKLQTADKMYNACFTKHMVTYASFIDAEIKEQDNTRKYIAGQKARRELNQKFKYELAYSCNAYVDIIEGKKQHVLQQFRSKKIDSTRITLLNENLAMQPHWANYFNRGQYFYYIGDLTKAEQDIKRCIQENPLSQNSLATSQESLLLALIYEEQKKYNEAIAIYDAINSKNINPSIALLKAIAYRKSNGYVFKPKQITEKGFEPVVAKEKIEKKPVKIKQRTSPRIPQVKKEQSKTPQTKNTQRQSALKRKDSTKSLRNLFKLDQ